MVIDSVTVGPLQENCYLVVCAETREALVIDPGDEPNKIIDMVEYNKSVVKLIVCTHGHWDHVLGVRGVQEITGAPFWMPENDWELLARDAHEHKAMMVGSTVEPVPPPDEFLSGGQTVDVGKFNFKVMNTPGHSPAHVSLYYDGHVFSGDCLFAGGIGRTDLPYANQDVLLNSLRAELLVLPDATVVYPGHGPRTTIGQERGGNPWLS